MKRLVFLLFVLVVNYAHGQSVYNLPGDTVKAKNMVVKGVLQGSIPYSEITGKPTIPAQFNPIEGANITITGVYPNMIFNAVGSSNLVTSVFGRIGDVVAASGDYSSFYYPLAGNPSGFLTAITSGQVIGALGYTPYNATNPNGYISGINSSMITTALGFTPYNVTNPSGYITLSSLANSAPITYNSGTGTIGITQATTSTNGYISSTDWNTFNGKQAALGFTAENVSNKTATASASATTYPNWSGLEAYAYPLSGNPSNFLTGNQSITLSGDVSGSGTTSITTAIGSGKVTNAMLAGSIAASKLVGSDIGTVGTVTNGTWNATPVINQYLANSGNDDFLFMQEMGSAMKGYNPGALVAVPVTTLALSTGNVYWQAIYVPKAATLTGIKTWLTTSGVYTSTGYNGVALYSVNASTGLLTQVAISTTSTTVWASTAAPTPLSIPFSSTYSASEGVYFVALLYQESAQTTAPVLYRLPSVPNLNTYDFSGNMKVTGIIGGQTTLPSTQASSGISANSQSFYLFVY